MTTHIAHMADEFFLANGFTITDPGYGKRRTASRGDLVLDIPPKCHCWACPEHNHPRYIQIHEGAQA